VALIETSGRLDLQGNGLLDFAGGRELAGAPADAAVLSDTVAWRLTLDREEFLIAVTGNSMSSAAANALVTQRLAADPPADPDA
jgi:hypothetical protein